MLSQDKYQEVIEFAHNIAETVGCGSLVHAHNVSESDVSVIDVEFSTHGLKVGYCFSSDELEYCRLPVAEYIATALGNQLDTLKIQCESNRRGTASSGRVDAAG